MKYKENLIKEKKRSTKNARNLNRFLKKHVTDIQATVSGDMRGSKSKAQQNEGEHTLLY